MFRFTLLPEISKNGKIYETTVLNVFSTRKEKIVKNKAYESYS